MVQAAVFIVCLLHRYLFIPWMSRRGVACVRIVSFMSIKYGSAERNKRLCNLTEITQRLMPTNRTQCRLWRGSQKEKGRRASLRLSHLSYIFERTTVL